ncbi:MAG: hypothetical protein CL698_00500 [Chloroflexi bacterium]|nr:hypothetical protein [Chloroflexota bacterium]
MSQRKKCGNCGKAMRRLYMQKNKTNGTRGMVATGWLCEGCNFSDIIAQFKDNKTNHVEHSALTCECQTCGSKHKKIAKKSTYALRNISGFGINKILEQFTISPGGRSLETRRLDGLIVINNMEETSQYLGIVLGIFIWHKTPPYNSQDVCQIAKSIYLKHATDLQREIIESVWKESWRVKGWQRILHGKNFKKKIKECGLDFDQILGMGIIMNKRVTESTLGAIETMNSPDNYVSTSIEGGNGQLAGAYAKKAAEEGDHEVTAKYMLWAIKGGNKELLEDYVKIKGQEAATDIIEHIENNWSLEDRRDTWGHDYSYGKREYYDALSMTKSPEAALFLIKDSFKENLQSQIGQIGDKDSDEPVIRAIATLPSPFDQSDMVATLVTKMDDYGSIGFLLHHYNEPKEAARLLKEVMYSPGDYEKTKDFIREATGFNSSYYKSYLLKKDPNGIRKFLFNDDPELRLKGVSMGKSEELDTEIKEFVFMMSFLDSEESVREGATELVKVIGIPQITELLGSNESFINIMFPIQPETWGLMASGSYGYSSSRDFSKREEYLERLIYYEDKQFLPIILEYIQTDSEIDNKLDSLLKSFDKNETVEMLLELSIEKAPDTCARNAAMKALSIDKLKTYSRIKDMIQMETGKERTERKQAVDRRLMFIDIFAEKATVEDLPHIQELMKKDRSPRVKRRFAKLMMNIDT